MGVFAQLSVLMGVALVLFIFWILWNQRKIRRAVVGHVWAMFYTPTGACYQALCPTNGNVLDAPQRAVASAPKVKVYIIQENKTFDILYPPGKPSWMQVSVPSTAYYEGDHRDLHRVDRRQRQMCIRDSYPRIPCCAAGEGEERRQETSADGRPPGRLQCYGWHNAEAG